VSDNVNDRIRVINLASQSVSTLQIQGTTDGNTTSLAAGKPTGLAINSKTGKLYFGSQGQLGALDKVYEVDLSTGNQRLIATGLENADALTLDRAGRLFVASAANGTVYSVDIQDASATTTTVSYLVSTGVLYW
jgi:sugar lactone lactonase YvrE